MDLKQIESFSGALRHVDTQLTTVDGRKYVEKRDATGAVVLEAAGSGLGFCPDYSPDKNVGIATDRLFVGSQDVASDYELLKKLGVTHILNTASSVIPCVFPEDFLYLIVEMFDDHGENLLDHYSVCEAFIDEARSNGGTVLVHCNAGLSRSASIAVAYVMHKEGLLLEQALERLRQSRPQVKPNHAFMEQLSQLERKLGINQ